MNQKKTLFAFLVVLCLAIPVTSPGVEASPEFAGGSGTAGDPYQVATWYHLYNLRISWRLSPDKYFILVNDLDENTEGYEELASETANGGVGWQPIGTWVNYFDGVFDGQRHEIRGLRINTAMNEAGLFGRAHSSTITNVGLVDVVVRGGANTGALVGYFSNSTMTGCYVTGNVSGGSDTGGLVGENYYGNISNSYFLGRVHGHRVGGIAGQNNFGHIGNCYSSGPVSGSECAGLTASCPYCGWLSTVNNSFWDIETSGTSWSAAGTGKTTAEMKDIATFADAGWDIGTTTLGDPTGGYPFLSWQVGNSPIWVMYEGTSTQCVESATGTGEVCITTSYGFIEDLQAVPPHSLPSVLFPHGMFDFKITGLTPGQTVTLTIEFPSPLPMGTLWWKYDNGRWYALPNESDNGDNIMVISLTDGGVHDLDDVPGQITDPGGPGNPMTVGWEGSPISKAAVMMPWIGLLAAIAGASLLLLGRRRVLS